jgi:hypothetical protein
MEIRSEVQTAEVEDEVLAITAVVRPILRGILFGLRGENVRALGGIENVSLFALADMRSPGDGDTGICFEYAVHDAMERCEPVVVERVFDALRRCSIDGETVSSILFGVEKAGAQQLIETASDRLTDDSALMSGSRGRPVKLKRHLTGIATAFRTRTAEQTLPRSIQGLWKADLFLGSADVDRWVGTTVKITPRRLESARGLRIGIVPTRQGRSDAVRLDEDRNLVICPVPYDGSFMEVFYVAWRIVMAVLASHAQMPSEDLLPTPVEREVARLLVQRRESTVLTLIDTLAVFSQPNLLRTEEEVAEVARLGNVEWTTTTSGILAPVPLQGDN